MRAWIVPKGCTSLEQLRLADRPEPVAGRRDVVVRVRATSLNYRDQAVVAGQYFGGAVSRDLIPMSDGAGDVIAVGSEVTRFKPGARVAATFFQPGPQPIALGSPLDGVLAERVALNEDGLVSIPEHLSYEEAACLPCAAVTAWHALFHAGRPLKAGDTVLVLGTGGVSIAALQFAKATGARVIATSSSDDKAARARALGASDVVNYERTPEWEQEVRTLTSGRGVDCVIEIGGAGTLARSIRSLARSGKVCLIGFLAGRDGGLLERWKVPAADGDAVIWLAYPKSTSKKYTSTLTRESGADVFAKAGFESVRMIAIDEDWTAKRLRRAQYIKTMTRSEEWAVSKTGKEKASRARR